MSIDLFGPPQRGPWVHIDGIGGRLSIRLDDELDQHILSLFLAMCERRRFARQRLDNKAGER